MDSSARPNARPFQVSVHESTLADLRARLGRTRWVESIPQTGWMYGLDTGYLRDFCDYWANEFDWRKSEATLNSHPQFLMEVDGVDIHFLHIKGKGANPVPLLLLHGWPGSIWEYIELLGPLADPGSHGGDALDSFDLVVPSIPGFGFGGAPMEPGWGLTRIARAFNTLMINLGYERYATQGGDWGALISAQIGADHPGNCFAIHVNQTGAGVPDDLPAELQEWGTRYRSFMAAETAYGTIQGTKPDALTQAQNDSPAGLAAWILEKFNAWGDVNGNIESRFSKETLASNLMFYWAPESTASAARIYYEFFRDAAALSWPPVTVPTAVAAYAHEPYWLPREIVETRYNVVQWTDYDSGGHFAALEEPATLIDDVRRFYRRFR